jgi:hypothetical protein
MPFRRLSDTTIVAAAGVLIVALGVAGALVAPAPDVGQGTSSSYSSGPGGARAAYLTLKRLGYHVERSIEPMASLHADPARTVLILSGEVESSAQDRRALDRFIRAGGVVLLTGERGAAFLDVTSATTAPRGRFDPADGGVSVHRPLAPSPMSRGAGEISMAVDAPSAALGPAYLGLYGSDTAVVAVARIGDGEAIWWAAPTPLSNSHIATRDNFQLLLNVVGPPDARTILWDEHYHGHARSLWSYIARTPLAWGLAQLGLAAVAAVLTFSRRQGPVRAAVTDVRTSPVEFVEMLGALYRRAGARTAAVSAARTRFRRTVGSLCGIPPQSGDAELARAGAARTGLDARVIQQLLEESAFGAADPTLNGAAAVSLTRRLQDMTARVGANRHMTGSPAGLNYVQGHE